MQNSIVLVFLFAVLAYSLPEYCPTANDLVVAYGSGTTLTNQGWTLVGGTGAATKAAFNLIGGSVSYTIDFTNSQPGVNGNIYCVSPSNLPSSGFTNNNYCDAQSGGTGWCMEVDWIESDGACGGQTTLHDFNGDVSGCSSWGCDATYYYNGVTKFDMTVSFDSNGVWTTTWNGNTISGSSLSPTPVSSDWATVLSTMQKDGAVIYSTLWTGWVPTVTVNGNNMCTASGGSLSGSSLTVSNLKITGTVVQGPTPTLCSTSSTTPPTTPPPPPSSTTPPPPPSSTTPPPPPSSTTPAVCNGLQYGAADTNVYWLQLIVPSLSSTQANQISVTCGNGFVVPSSAFSAAPASWNSPHEFTASPSSQCTTPRTVNINGNACKSILASPSGSVSGQYYAANSTAITTNSNPGLAPWVYAVIGVAVLVVIVGVVIAVKVIISGGTDRI